MNNIPVCLLLSSGLMHSENVSNRAEASMKTNNFFFKYGIIGNLMANESGI